MIVECPNCHTKFKLADEKIGEKGIKVRCSKCKYVFEVKKTPPESEGFEFEEEQFDFSEDVDFGEEEISTERAPQTPAHQDYAVSEEFSLGEEPQEGEEKGVSFGEEEPELGISTDMPEIPDEEPGEDFLASGPDFGEASEEEFGDFKIDRSEEIPVSEEEPGEEFDFSDHLESYARTEVPSREKEPSEDDLEAKLDLDTSAYPTPEPAPAPSPAYPEPSARAPARPIPRTYEEEKGGLGKKLLIFILILLFLSPLAGLGYLQMKGSYTFSDLLKGDFAKLKTVPEIEKILVRLGLAKPSIKGEVVVLKDTLEVQTLRRRDGSHILVISGEIKNEMNVSVRFVRVVANLYDKNRNLLAQGYSYCDVSFTRSELINLPRSDLEAFMDMQGGRNTLNLEIAPGDTREFGIIFFKIPPRLESYNVKVADYEVLETHH